MTQHQKERYKNRKWRTTGRFLKRSKAAGLACIIALAMGIGILPQPSGHVLAGYVGSGLGHCNILSQQGGQIPAPGKIADTDTAATYQQVFGKNEPAEYAGRIWTDKSVYSSDAQFPLQGGSVAVVKNDSDFLVAYSALAGAQIIHGQSKAPVDALFVVDLSGSMTSQMDNGKTRISNTIQALNTSIAKVMAMNAYTRVGVVGFNGTSAVLLPLDHYTPNKTAAYFRLTDENTNLPALRYEAVGSDHSLLTGSMAVSGGTNIQCGIYDGMKLLTTTASTSVSIAGKEVKRLPSVILLSDGAPTFSSDSGSWWAPANNNNQGPGNSPYTGNAIKVMMTASYLKAEIDRHYNIATDGFHTTVYTVGMGITGLTDEERNLADITLHPSAYWNSETSISKTIKDTWIAYASGSNPSVDVNRQESYVLTHPPGNDIASIRDYVDAYYDADDSDSVADVFEKIVEDIVLTAPKIPTQIKGEDPGNDGFITYTDPIGAYMEVKDVKALLYGGTEYRQKDVSVNENTTSYTFEGTIASEVYGQQSMGLIKITVTTDEEQNETLTVKIPAAAIPLHVNTVVRNVDDTVKSSTDNGAVPLRVLYTVGMREEVLTEGSVSPEKISADYLTKHWNKDGTISFYSNLCTGANTVLGNEAGNATTKFEPSQTNPYYYNPEDGTLLEAHIAKSNSPKQENFTATAESSHALVYAYTDPHSDSKEGMCVTYLGNNGLLKLPLSKATEAAVLSGSTYLKVTKELTGRGWSKEDTFSFTLKTADSDTADAIEAQLVQLPENATGLTVTAKQKEASFDDIIFHREGTYHFLIAEESGNAPGMTYDTHTVGITVVVTDAHNGKLAADVSSMTGSMVFQNNYTPDTKNEGGTPTSPATHTPAVVKPAANPTPQKTILSAKTGDEFPIVGFVVTGIAALAVGLAVLVVRKKEFYGNNL